MRQIDTAILRSGLVSLMLIFFPGQGGVVSAAPDDYSKVRSVLRDRCFACHGALKQEAGLRLDTVSSMLKGGDSGAVLKAGDAVASLLVQRTESSDPAERMPPEGEPLKQTELAALRAWISAGAQAPADEQAEEDPRSHWSFLPPVRPVLPQNTDSAWVRTPIDAFISAEHLRNGLTPQSAADRLTWLRRVTLDLTGLPPGTAEQAMFLADESPAAWDRVVDRLLASPQ